MVRLTPAELNFLLMRAVQELPRGVLRDLCGKPDVRERGIRAATIYLGQAFEGHEVHGPEVDPRMDFGGMEKG